MRNVSAGRAALVAGLAAVVMLSFGAVADAAVATGGCTASATSYDADGNVVDTMKAPGPGGTQDDPFVVAGDGSVAWEGTSKVPITTGTWAVSIGGAQVYSGDIDNAEAKTSVSGVQEIADLPAIARLPLQLVLLTDGTVQVDAVVTGSGQACAGTVWLTGVGGATGTPLFWMGAGALLIAALLLFWLIAGTTETVVAGAAPAAETIHGMEVT